jgi:hypothetical protein
VSSVFALLSSAVITSTSRLALTTAKVTLGLPGKLKIEAYPCKCPVQERQHKNHPKHIHPKHIRNFIEHQIEASIVDGEEAEEMQPDE